VILDTNALSAMADGDPAMERFLRQATGLALPVIVLGEYRYGIQHSRNRARYEQWLQDLMENCQVLDVDRGTTARYAEVRGELRRIGRPIPGNDVWIAALARQHSLPLLSRDAHFDAIPGLGRVAW
jgi:tRNA(fMet)-specific endonuclease VapC